MTIPARIFWLGLLALGLAIGFLINGHRQCGPPPLPKVKAVNRKFRTSQSHQGAAAAVSIAKAAAVPPVWRTNVILWRYPSGIDPNALWWNIEASTNLRHWFVVRSNATGDLTIVNDKAQRMRVFRLVGRKDP